jgi:hypothetical protein
MDAKFRRMMRLPMVAAVVIAGVVLILTACGQTDSGATHGTLTGTVVASPTCPVQNADQPCAPVPVRGRLVQALDTRGQVVASAKTDDQGRFSLSLAPGSYVIHVAIVQGQPGLRQTTPGNVTVSAGQSASLNIELDTGIR